MKALSLLEPWGSLIKEKVKYIETRSFKTNYRGDLYIHTSKKQLTIKSRENYEKLLALLKNTHFNYGCLIAKCKLVDCICMTEEFISEIKKNNNEYICGDYQVGRYAWILDDIEPLETPILAKGQLGVWEYKDQL